MKETYWGYWLIKLGVFVVVIMMLISNVTTQNTEDYYLIQEVTEAAMVDAVNYGYYREYGELKIDREKFIESFLRRFSENVSLNTYEISFYGIYEAPPKVSVRVASKTKTFIIAGDQTTFDIVNKVDAILELSAQGSNSSNASGDNDLNSNNWSSNNNNSTNQNNNQNSNSRVPNRTDLLSITAQNWYQSKYINCPKDSNGWCRNNFNIKNDLYGEYKNNSTHYLNEILADWQRWQGITFTESEKNAFLEIARNTLL